MILAVIYTTQAAVKLEPGENSGLDGIPVVFVYLFLTSAVGS